MAFKRTHWLCVGGRDRLLDGQNRILKRCVPNLAQEESLGAQRIPELVLKVMSGELGDHLLGIRLIYKLQVVQSFDRNVAIADLSPHMAFLLHSPRGM